jgi:integrase
MTTPMDRRRLAYFAAEYINQAKKNFDSRDWMNIRAALAKLIAGIEDELTYASLRDAAKKLSADDTLTKSYRRACIGKWSRFLAYLVEYEEVDADLLHRFRCVRLRYPLNRKECQIPEPGEVDPRKQPIEFIAQVMKSLPSMTKQQRDIVVLLALTGARPHELLELTTGAIDTRFQPWVAVINRHKTEHQGKERYLIFTARAQVILDRYRMPFTPADCMFPAPKNTSNPISVGLIQNRLRRHLKKHNLPPYALYDLRRWAATTARRSGDLQSAQALLGHSRASTTEIYAPPDLSRAIDAATKLGENLQ